MGIKITPADSWFSKCVRKRANWACEMCGAQHDESSTGLHCSHFHGRGNWSLRFNPDNVRALCFGCHAKMGANPFEHTEWFKEQVGEGMFQILLDLKRDVGLAKDYRKTKGKGDISKHFKQQFEQMQDYEIKEIEPFL